MAAGRDVGAIDPPAGWAAVRWRWLVLLAAVVIPFGLAFAIGSATKSSSPPAISDSLARASSAGTTQQSVVGVNGAVTVPPLRAPAKHARLPSTGVRPTTTTSVAPPNTTTSVAPPTTTSVQTTPTTTGGGGGVPSGGGSGAPSGGGGT